MTNKNFDPNEVYGSAWFVWSTIILLAIVAIGAWVDLLSRCK